MKRRSFRKPKIRGRALELLSEWEGGLEAIALEMAQAKARVGSIQSEKPDSVMKAGVYRLLTQMLDSRTVSTLEQVLEYKIAGRLPSMPFSESPFYWAFKAIVADGEVECDARSISRYGAELLYAHKHKIPPELLIGFISQVGGSSAIRKKLNAGRKETWFTPKLSWLS